MVPRSRRRVGSSICVIGFGVALAMYRQLRRAASQITERSSESASLAVRHTADLAATAGSVDDESLS